MRMTANNIRLQFDEKQRCEFVLVTEMPAAQAIAEVLRLKKPVADGGELDIEIKEHEAKRSGKANACLWKLCGGIASAKKCGKEEAYLELLQKYGVSAHIIARPEALERLKGGWRFHRILGHMDLGGRKSVHAQCFFGSHSFSAPEFAALLNGAQADLFDLNGGE